MNKPRGKQSRVQKSVRIEPRFYEAILRQYGSFTKFVDHKIKTDRKLLQHLKDK